MNQFLDDVRSSLQEQIIEVNQYAGEVSLEIQPQHLLAVCQILKEKFGFTYLSDITATDMFTDQQRFRLSYNLFNLTEKKRIRISCRVNEENPEVDSLCELWPSANWNEREAFDMMGIKFKNHPDLRRMFMPEDFEYFPLRKEFPLIGIAGSIEVPEKDPPKPYK